MLECSGVLKVWELQKPLDLDLVQGAGIGVSPNASVLRQLLDEYNRSLYEC